MKYFIKKVEKSPFYQKQHSQEVYLLCEKSGKVIAEVNDKLPWYVTEKTILTKGNFKLESTNLSSKFLEIGDTVSFNHFMLGEIERIEFKDTKAGYDWEDKFYLKNCRLCDPGWESSPVFKASKEMQEEKQVVLRNLYEHAGYVICIFLFSEEQLWDIIEEEWIDLTDFGYAPGFEETMNFWKEE